MRDAQSLEIMPITKESGGSTVRWVRAEAGIEMPFDTALDLAAEFAERLVEVQDPEVRDIVFLGRTADRTIVRIDVP